MRQHSSFIAVRFALVFIVLTGFFGAGVVTQASAAAEANPVALPIQLQGAFPSTALLDNFNNNGSLSSSWTGDGKASYSVSGQHLNVNSNSEIDIYWTTLFGVDQEAYVKLTSLLASPASTSETSLILKKQGSNSSNARVAVVYKPYQDVVQVWTYSGPQSWQQRGGDIPVTFANGDIMGARALATGQVEVYRNGTLLDTRNITSWPYYALAGSIGISNFNSSGTALDDFGGGTLAGSPTLTPTACSDPTACNPVEAISALWKCVPSETFDCQGPLGADWGGSVITWPSWAAYQTNSRTGSNARSVVSASGNVPLYPYMGTWADGCQVTALTDNVLIIEWVRGTDVWDETHLSIGQSYTIDLISPQDNAMIESNGATSFAVSLANCNPQPLSGPTFTPTATPTVTNTFTASPSPTLTATATQTYTPTFTATSTNTATFTPTFTSTSVPTSTHTATYTPTPSFTPTFTATHTATYTSTPVPTSTHTATFTATNTATYTSTPVPTSTHTATYTPTPSFTPTFTATYTATSTSTPVPTSTHTATFTSTSTSTTVPTSTHTATYTPTATFTSTAVPTSTYTATYTSTATNVPTSTHTATFTPTASRTPTATFTLTSSPTATFTATRTPTYTPTSVVPTKTKKINQTPLPTKPPRQSSAIEPSSLITYSGLADGSLSSLGLIEQDGFDDNPSAYVQFETSNLTYLGYKSFYLPTNAQVANISAMLLQVNFKKTEPAQVWTWSAYDWTTGNWVSLGDSRGTQHNEWNTMLFSINSVSRYVSAAGEVRIRLQSGAQIGDLKLDYESLHITYEPVAPTPTNVVPTALPTKPPYIFPATFTPTTAP